MSILRMTLPAGLSTAISRRHRGYENITKGEATTSWNLMKMYYKDWKKNVDALNYCEDEWWAKMEIEKHYKERRWYYGHQKRRRLMNNLDVLHRKMFFLLVNTDRNSGQEFSRYSVIDPESIFEDFKSKYYEKTL